MYGVTGDRPSGEVPSQPFTVVVRPNPTRLDVFAISAAARRLAPA